MGTYGVRINSGFPPVNMFRLQQCDAAYSAAYKLKALGCAVTLGNVMTYTAKPDWCKTWPRWYAMVRHISRVYNARNDD